jgi:hypothetical protein
MAVVDSMPRELMAVSYEVVGSVTGANSGDAHGKALNNTWGGSFIVGNRTTVDLEISVPYLAVNNATGVFAEVHVLVDGTCRAEGFIPHQAVGATVGLGLPVYRKVRLVGLTAGSHTVSVQVKIGVTTNTGTIAGSTTNPGLLRVVEV